MNASFSKKWWITLFVILMTTHLCRCSLVNAERCTVSENLIHEYDNSKAKTDFEVESQTLVGVGKSASQTLGESETNDKSDTQSLSVGSSVGASFWGFGASVQAEVMKSATIANSASNSWAQTSAATWNRQTVLTNKYSVPPGVITRVWQEIATCGTIVVRNAKIRREDIDVTSEENREILKHQDRMRMELMVFNTSAHLELYKHELKLRHAIEHKKLELVEEERRQIHEISQGLARDNQDFKMKSFEQQNHIMTQIMNHTYIIAKMSEVALDPGHKNTYNKAIQTFGEEKADGEHRREQERKEQEHRHKMDIEKLLRQTGNGTGSSGNGNGQGRGGGVPRRLPDSDDEDVESLAKLSRSGAGGEFNFPTLMIVGGVLVILSCLGISFCAYNVRVRGQREPSKSSFIP